MTAKVTTQLPERPKQQSTPAERFAMELQTMGLEGAGSIDAWIDHVEDDAPFMRGLMTSSWFMRDGLGVLIPDDVYMGIFGNTQDPNAPKGDAKEQQKVFNDLSASLRIAARGSRGLAAADAWIRGDIANAWLTVTTLWSQRHMNRKSQAQMLEDAKATPMPRRDVLMQIAQMMGVSVKRLENNMTTCRAWKHEDRYPSSMLSNSHHEVLNSLEPSLRKEWAERAITESLSVAKLRSLLQEEGLSIKVEYDDKGNVVGQTAEFVAEGYSAAKSIHTIANWYEHTRSKHPYFSEKGALIQVLETFERAGLITFKATAWQNAVAEGNELLAGKGE